MLFMVMERFKHGAAKLVGERFRRDGRMLPEGLSYHASWMNLEGTRCFQLMETPDPQLLMKWVQSWIELIEFEIIPVTTSRDYWSQTPAE